MRKIIFIIFIIVVLLVLAGGGYFISKLVGGKTEIEGVDFNIDQPNVTSGSSAETGGAANQPANNQAVPVDDGQPKIMAQILQPGEGEGAKNGDTVSVHYVGTLEDGTKFDSSVDRGQPFSFTLGAGQVIPGWDLGVVGMKVGEVRKLIIPSVFAYGEQGASGVIPPNATLIFEVQMLGINQ
ncbi:FKBP-type peptidyl-prolyl cis-trans isomerase [Patescibacteria group bacterium]|nr:FKBP-type peptidyl-prolyl cis-trans isomerase [Patescibacteria group bacterium]